MKKIKYPTTDELVEINKLVLIEIKVKKADKPELLSYSALKNCIENCENTEGDVYAKASILLKSLVLKHPFASGNRRTALVATKKFLLDNNVESKLKNDEEEAKVLKKIRYGEYKDEEIKEWLKTGKIGK